MMTTRSLVYGLCPCVIILAFTAVGETSAFAHERQRREVPNFPVSKLLGEWYDVGRTTFVSGPATWTSQQWNFVQGQDGTLIALFNGMCKECGGCSDAILFKVTENSDSDGGFVLRGRGETMSLRVESDLQSEIVVSICLHGDGDDSRGGHSYPPQLCPQSMLQVSVLSRQPVLKHISRWTNIIMWHLPASINIDQLDTTAGEGCPKLFIDPKLVTEDLVSHLETNVLSLVGFDSRRSAIVLPCSLGKHASSLQHDTHVVWKREQADVLLTKNDTVLKRANGAMLLHGAEDGRFDLLLQGVSEEDADVYTCYLHGTNTSHILLSRVAVSSASFPSHPSIVYHTQNVIARKGETTVLECYATGNPPPLITWWIKSSDAAEAYIRKGKGGNKLRLWNVDAGDEGVYKCEASSSQGPRDAALLSLQVGFPPETRISENSVSAHFRGQMTLTCYVQIKSPLTLVWRKEGMKIEPDYRRSISLIQMSEYVFELRLLIREMRKEDFGRYSCLAKDQLGESVSGVDVLEQTYVDCAVNDIPVMEDFRVQRFLGDMNRVEATETETVRGDNNQTSVVSELQGFFITVSGSLVQYHRGFSGESLHCQEPWVSSLVSLDAPGDYVLIMDGQRVRHKIVYTDYTHAVTYTCTGGSDQLPCPRSREHVQIVSRHSHIPAEVLHTLYGHVQRACVPVSSLVESVPGICQMPADFMYKKGWIGKYPGLNCQVAKLQTQGNLTAGHVTGKWHLIGEVRPEDYTAAARTSMHIIPSGDQLIRLYRSVESGICTATEVDVWYKSMTAGSYYYDHNGRTVDSKLLLVDEASLVLYTCLALKHDGTCYQGSELVELYHRDSDIDRRAMLWLIRALSNACVDVKRLVRVAASDACPVPERVVMAARGGLVKGGHMHIGCHRSLIINYRESVEEKLAGHWTVMYRNVESMFSSSPVGQFSQSYHVIYREAGVLTVMVRHFESEWGLCPPTRVLQLVQRSGLGDYVHISHSTTILFKVLSISEDTAAVYWCASIGRDGVCRPESLTVEILARSPQTPISRERLQTLMQKSVDVCVKFENMQPTSQVENCTITDTLMNHVAKGRVTAVFDIPVMSCKNQLIKGEQNLDVEKLTGKWTVLWRNKEFWSMRAPFAESSYVIPTHYGLLYLWRSWNNDLDQCGPEEAGRFITTSGPGDYYSGFDGVPVAMKVVKMTNDSKTMLALWCHLDDESRCHPHRTTIEILSRSNTLLDNDTRDELLNSIDLECVSTPEWVSSEPDMCHVENDVLTTAYINGLEVVEYSKMGCHVDIIESQAGVTDDMIIGSWQSVYQSNLSDSDGPAAKIEFHFTKTAEGPISLVYRLYNSDKQGCLPTRMMELTRDEQRPGTVYQLKYCNKEEPYGFVFVLYADGDHLAILLCVGILNDRMCDPLSQNLVLLHRDGERAEVNDTLLDTVRGLGADACVDPNPLVSPTLDPCPVPEPILTDISTGELEACSDVGDRVQCYPRYIPVHPAFDIRDFSGTWYTKADLVEDPPVGAATFHFVPKNNNTVAMLHTYNRSGRCKATILKMLIAVGDGQFYFTFNNTQEPYPLPEGEDFLRTTSEYKIGMMKVVWMNSNMALTYWCFDATDPDTPSCPKKGVALLSRQPPVSDGGEAMGWMELLHQAELRSLVADLCIMDKFVTVSSEPCTIPGEIVSAVEDDAFAIAASTTLIQCAEEFVPAVPDFDMSQFSGLWYTVRQTYLMWGNATWQSLIRSFVMHNDGSIIMAFTGHPADKAHCMPMDIRMLTLSNGTGEWTYTEGSETVTVKVIWTDYNTSALLYACKGEVQADGLCPTSSLQVELVSRSPNATLEALEVMGQLLPLLCVRERNVRAIVTSQCRISAELEHLVGGASGGGDGGGDPVTPCRVKDIPLESNFTLKQMQGIWYEQARTRFTFSTMESVISVYKYDPDRDVLHGLFIGTLHKQCQSPLRSITKKKFTDGPDSIIEARIQVGESFFPWITFNILYYDGSLLVHLACYAENEDGTCPRHKTEVTVLGRTRQMTSDSNLRGTLTHLMHSMCLSRPDLVPTKETADCLPKLMTREEESSGLPDTSACKLSDIPVVDSVDKADLLGTWYGLGSVDYSVTADQLPGFVVSIQHSTEDTLQWKQWNIRNGTCHGEKAVYMKSACRGGNTTGDYISTKGSSFMLQWTAFKILRLQGDLMLVYSCTQETYEGTCEPEGIRVDLLGRSTMASLDDIIPLLDALPFVCLKPESMKSVVSTKECDALASESVTMVKTSACAVDKLPAIHVEPEELLGLWYEVAHTVDKMFPMVKALFAYQTLPNHQLAMFFSAMDASGQCQGPMQGVLQQHCDSQLGRETLGRLKFPGIWSWAPWRILHADNISLIGLSCMDEQRDGSCSPHGLKVFFLSRDPSPEADLRPRLYGVLKEMSCFEEVDMEDVYHEEGPSCKDKLDPVLAPAA